MIWPERLPAADRRGGSVAETVSDGNCFQGATLLEFVAMLIATSRRRAANVPVDPPLRASTRVSAPTAIYIGVNLCIGR